MGSMITCLYFSYQYANGYCELFCWVISLKLVIRMIMNVWLLPLCTGVYWFYGVDFVSTFATLAFVKYLMEEVLCYCGSTAMRAGLSSFWITALALTFGNCFLLYGYHS